MITVNIPHFNRPYFLDLNVRLLRHFVGDSIRIVIADDGSDTSVVELIKKMPIDDIYVNNNNVQKPFGVGSFSETMRQSMKLCKTDYYMFCEDDFVYLKRVIPPETVEHVPSPGSFIPKINTQIDHDDVFGTTVWALSNMAEIGMIKLQCPRKFYKRIKHKGAARGVISTTIGGFNFHVTKMCSTVCSSWPYVIRRDIAEKSQPPPGMNVWARQSFVKLRLVELMKSQKTLLIHPGRMLHIGNGLSVNVTNRQTDDIRHVKNKKIRSIIGSKSIDKLCSLFCSGKFYFDLNETLEIGIDSAFNSAFERLGKL